MPLVGAGHTEITPLRVATCKSPESEHGQLCFPLATHPMDRLENSLLSYAATPGNVWLSGALVGQLRGRVATCLHLRQHHQLWLRALVYWFDLKLLSRDLICQRQLMMPHNSTSRRVFRCSEGAFSNLKQSAQKSCIPSLNSCWCKKPLSWIF